MNIEQRIEKLENLIGVSGDEPMIIINVSDYSKGSQDEASPLLVVVPGRVGGPKGITMFRGKDEAPDNFLKRCEAKHSEFYG
jgi:hypothetical protein